MNTHKINTHGILTIKNNPLRDKPQHTPTPWEICGDRKPIKNIKDPIFFKLGIRKGGRRIAEAHGIGEEETKANAAFIVKAVNNHDALVEACRAALVAGGLDPLIERALQNALAQAEKG